MKRRIWNFVRRVPAHIDYHTGLTHLLPQSEDAILCYHAVGEQIGNHAISTERFQRDLKHLSEHYKIVGLSEIGSSSKKKQVALTFDDGYQNFYNNVFPLLQEFNIPATVFVITEFIDTDNCELINSRLNINISDPSTILSGSELEELARSDLVTIGNHTRTHPNFADRNLTDHLLEEEISGAKNELEERFNITINQFSYPHGFYSPALVSKVQENHQLAVTTKHGSLTAVKNTYYLPRVQGHESEPLVRWETTRFSNWLWDNIVIKIFYR